MNNIYVVKYLEEFFYISHNFMSNKISFDESYHRISNINLLNIPEDCRYTFSELINNYISLSKKSEKNRKNFKKDFIKGSIKGFTFAILHIWDYKEIFNLIGKFFKNSYDFTDEYNESLLNFLKLVKYKYIDKDTFIKVINNAGCTGLQKFALEAAWERNFFTDE